MWLFVVNLFSFVVKSKKSYRTLKKAQHPTLKELKSDGSFL